MEEKRITIEIGKNLKELLLKAGQLNEKWDDFVHLLTLFLREDFSKITIEKTVSGDCVDIWIRKVKDDSLSLKLWPKDYTLNNFGRFYNNDEEDG